MYVYMVCIYVFYKCFKARSSLDNNYEFIGGFLICIIHGFIFLLFMSLVFKLRVSKLARVKLKVRRPILVSLLSSFFSSSLCIKLLTVMFNENV